MVSMGILVDESIDLTHDIFSRVFRKAYQRKTETQRVVPAIATAAGADCPRDGVLSRSTLFQLFLTFSFSILFRGKENSILGQLCSFTGTGWR